MYKDINKRPEDKNKEQGITKKEDKTFWNSDKGRKNKNIII